MVVVTQAATLVHGGHEGPSIQGIVKCGKSWHIGNRQDGVVVTPAATLVHNII